MRARTKVAAAVVAVAALVVGTLMLRGGPESRPAAAGEARGGPRVHWPEGKRFTYALSWRAKTGGEVAPGPDGKTSQEVSMESAVDGEIALERVAGGKSRAQVALSWSRFDKFSFSMQGHEATGDVGQVSAALTGQTAFLEIDDRGRISDIAFPPEMTPSARAILRSLALELRYTLPESDISEWEAVERDSLGEVQVRYRSGLHELARESIAYRQLDAVRGELAGKQQLHGGTVIALDADGLPVSIEETIGASYTRPTGKTPAVQSAWSFTLHRTGESRSNPALAAAALRAKGQPLGAQVEDPDREKRRDQNMAEGMSLDDMLLALDRFETGTRPGHQFLVKAAAWLRLHPEGLAYMTAKFKSKEMTVKGRGLILDVLAETGTAGAQKAMRDALGSEVARARPRDFSILVQRFTFVIAPDRASIDFLEREYDAADRTPVVAAAQGAAVALGSAVRRLDDQLDHALAKEVNEKLRASLRQASTPEMRGALVAALGNAGREEDVPDLVAVAGDPDVRVRDQVATALRTVDSASARAGLISLAADPSSAVAISAFGSLQKQSLQDADWQALASLAREGRTPTASDSALVDLVREKGTSRAEGQEILGKLLQRNQGGDSDLPVIIRSLLQPSRGG